MSKKRVLVAREQCLGEPYRIALSLPEESGVSDLVVLKNEFLRHTKASGSIVSFGGSQQTTIDEVVVVHFDEDFNVELMFEPTEPIHHLQSGIIIKIRPSQISTKSS